MGIWLGIWGYGGMGMGMGTWQGVWVFFFMGKCPAGQCGGSAGGAGAGPKAANTLERRAGAEGGLWASTLVCRGRSHGGAVVMGLRARDACVCNSNVQCRVWPDSPLKPSICSGFLFPALVGMDPGPGWTLLDACLGLVPYALCFVWVNCTICVFSTSGVAWFRSPYHVA